MIRVSPSQISTFRLCRRKWSFSRPENLGTRSGPSAALGTEVHETIERWTRDGVPFDLSTRAGQIAFPGLRYYASPGVGRVEGEIRVEIGEVVITGRIDHERSPEEANDDLPWIDDYKTTSEIARWAKTADDLLEDVQCMTYAEHALRRYGTKASNQRWIYLQTKPSDPRAKLVSLTVTRDDTARVLDEACETALEIKPYAGASPLDVEPTLSACAAFGGCPYLAECGVTANQRIGAAMSNMSLREKMEARKREREGLVNPPAAAPAPAATEAPKPAPAVVEAHDEAPRVKPGGLSARIAAKRQEQAAPARDSKFGEEPSYPEDLGENLVSNAAPVEAPKAEEAPAPVEAPKTEAAPVVAVAYPPPRPEAYPEPNPLEILAEKRDTFAAAALSGLLARGTPHGTIDELARLAYEYAGAMLRERGE